LIEKRRPVDSQHFLWGNATSDHIARNLMQTVLNRRHDISKKKKGKINLLQALFSASHGRIVLSRSIWPDARNTFGILVDLSFTGPAQNTASD
jgi:hypothetical protein